MAMNSEPPVTETSQEEPDPPAERLAYSVNEAARLTGLSRDLLYDQMRRGNLLYVKIGIYVTPRAGILSAGTSRRRSTLRMVGRVGRRRR